MVADQRRAALTMIPVDRLIAAPDCGMVTLDRAAAALELLEGRTLEQKRGLVRDRDGGGCPQLWGEA